MSTRHCRARKARATVLTTPCWSGLPDLQERCLRPDLRQPARRPRRQGAARKVGPHLTREQQMIGWGTENGMDYW
jgi:hypothetical protein